MADFGKVNPEKAQAIINALKDGRINSKEMEKLGLTAEEAKALNEAFSSGKVEVGDFVLVNKGQVEKDGKKIQLSSTQKNMKNQAKEEDSMWKTVGRYAGGALAVGGGLLAAAALVTSAPAWAGIAAIGAGALLLTSCEKDTVEVGGKHEYNLSTTVSQTTEIPIKLPVIDYTPYFNTLITQLNELQNDQAKNFSLVIDGLNKIFNKQNATADDIEAILNNLRKVINNQQQQIKITTKNGEDMKTFGENLMKILNEMKQIMNDTNLTVKEKTDKISALLSQLSGQVNNIETISANIETISTDTNQTVHSIDEKLDKLKGLFPDDIVKAINALASKVDGSNVILGNIYDAIVKGGDNSKAIKALLEKVLKNQETQINNNSAGFKAILDAIKNIPSGGTVDLSKVEALLAAIKNGVDDNGTMLKQITQQNDTVIMILKSFRKEAGDKMDGIDAWLEAIYNKIPAGGEGGCKIDFDKLMAKLDEILQAIKDHDVHVDVTVDVTGKVQCECKCDGKVVHEGVLGNLADLLG